MANEQIAEAAIEAIKPIKTNAEENPKRQHSRKPLPEHLDRHDEVLSIGEACHCGGKLKTLGEVITEELEYGEKDPHLIQ